LILCYGQAGEPQMEKLSLKDMPNSDHKTTAEVELDRLENELRTVQLALEILTGVCATLPDPEPDMVAGQVDMGDAGQFFQFKWSFYLSLLYFR
jgi:hypothetical protein